MNIFTAGEGLVVQVSFHFMQKLSASSEVLSSVDEAFEQTVRRLNGGVSASQEQLEAIAREVEAATEAISERKDDSEDQGKTIGTALLEWAKKMDPEKICLFTAGFDFKKARHLYMEVDHRAVLEMYAARISYEEQVLTSRFEAAMYGFGGSYKEDKAAKSSAPSEEGVTVVDLTAGATEENMIKLKAGWIH